MQNVHGTNAGATKQHQSGSHVRSVAPILFVDPWGFEKVADTFGCSCTVPEREVATNISAQVLLHAFQMCSNGGWNEGVVVFHLGGKILNCDELRLGDQMWAAKMHFALRVSIENDLTALGRSQTTTNVVPDDPNVRATRRIYETCWRRSGKIKLDSSFLR